MRKMKSSLVYITILFTSFISCSDKHGEYSQNEDRVDYTNYKKKNFDSTVIKIEKDLDSSLTYDEELLYLPDFVDLYKHDSIYLDDAIQSLTREKLTGWKMYIAYYAMQNLDINDYLKYCKTYIDLFDQGKINEAWVEAAVMPHFLKYRIIAKNYKNPQVKELLTNLIEDRKISEQFRSELKEIRSGEMIKGMEKDDYNMR